MSSLSISAAWEESKAILGRDGQLYLSVALALIALPTTINTLVNPGGMTNSTPGWAALLGLVASLIGVAGQLALIRLALGPSVTVGGAIVHGLRRLPVYIASVLIIILCFLIVGVPLIVLAMALGVPLQAKPVPASPGLLVLSLLFFALVLFLAVRFIMAGAVASAEQAGPIAILKRSWNLTSGHFWPLFGFIVVYLIAAVVVLLAVVSATGALVGLFIGSVQPLSTGALILALVQAVVSAAVSTLFFVMIARIYAQLAGRDAQVSVRSSGT